MSQPLSYSTFYHFKTPTSDCNHWGKLWQTYNFARLKLKLGGSAEIVGESERETAHETENKNKKKSRKRDIMVKCTKTQNSSCHHSSSNRIPISRHTGLCSFNLSATAELHCISLFQLPNRLPEHNEVWAAQQVSPFHSYIFVKNKMSDSIQVHSRK